MAYNSAYTGSQVDAAVGAVRQKETKWDNKQDELTGTEDQLVGFNSAGEAVAVAKPDPLPTGGETGQVLTKTSTGAQWDDIPSDLPAGGTDGQILTKTADGVAWEDAPEGGVTSFNSRTGAITPQAGDYTAEMVGAVSESDVGVANGVAELDSTGKVPASQLPSMDYIPNSEKGANSGVATLDASGKLNATQKPTYTANEVGARPNTWTPTASDVGAVPTSRTVNGQALSQNITLDAEDVGAIPPPTRLTATLSSSRWSGNSQTITVNGVITNTSVQDIDISCADKASADAWAAGGVWCNDPTLANRLTFTCTTPPTANINLRIRLWEVG